MKEIAFQKVSKIMRRTPLIYSSSKTVSALLGGLYETGSHEALVTYEGGVGLVTVRDLLGVSHPERTLLGRIARNVPSLLPEATVLEAVDSMISNGVRAVPVIADEEIVGIVSEKEVMDALPESEIFGEILCKEVMRQPIISVNENDKTSTARSLMREHGVDYLPVISGRGQLRGMITAKDIVFTFIQPRERVTRGKRIGERVRLLDIPVKGLMDRNPLTVGQREPLLEVVRDFKRYGKDVCIVKECSEILGIITSREVVPLILGFKVSEEVPVYILGFPELGDFQEVEVAQSKVMRVLDKGMSFYQGVLEVVIDVKRRKRRGGRSLYQVTARVYSPTKRFSVTAQGWYLSGAFDDLCRRLDRKLGAAKRVDRRERAWRRHLAGS